MYVKLCEGKVGPMPPVAMGCEECYKLPDVFFLCRFAQYVAFLDQLSEAMKVDSIAVDLGSDMRMKLMLTRAEQMVQQETASLMESKCQSFSLQRKVGWRCAVSSSRFKMPFDGHIPAAQ